MASLKEVKTRIGSVRTTRKITNARQIIASTKLYRAQEALAGAHANRDALQALWNTLGLPHDACATPAQAADKPLAVVAIASDSGMAGAFNLLIAKEIEHNPAHAELHAIGTRIGGSLPGNIPLEALRELCVQLTERFLRGEIAGVELVYHDFRSMARQPVVREQLLPMAVVETTERQAAEGWIVEPDTGAVAEQLASLLLLARLWTALLSSRASEHLARTIAMQAATDNADDLLDELQLTYNKLRQQNITSELLDIIGSSFA